MSSRIATISMMRNESDIIEAFARYHLQFVDGMLFIDHRSNDNSCQIVESLSKEGLPISLVKTNDLAHNQSRLINAYAYRTAKKYRADWIIPLDLDECLHAPNLESPIQELTEYKGNKPIRIPWRTYVPTSTLNGPEPLQQSPYANALHFAKTIAHSYSELLSDVKSNKRKGHRYPFHKAPRPGHRSCGSCSRRIYCLTQRRKDAKTLNLQPIDDS